MDDATASRHPLHITGGNGAMVSHAVAVLNRTGQDVGNGFNTAMRVPREASKIILRNVVAKVVQQQEWVEIPSVAKPERATTNGQPAPSSVGLDEQFA